jgi:hypothetical protein
MKHFWTRFTGCVDTCARCGARRFETQTRDCLSSDLQKRQDLLLKVVGTETVERAQEVVAQEGQAGQ